MKRTPWTRRRIADARTTHLPRPGLSACPVRAPPQCTFPRLSSLCCIPAVSPPGRMVIFCPYATTLRPPDWGGYFRVLLGVDECVFRALRGTLAPRQPIPWLATWGGAMLKSGGLSGPRLKSLKSMPRHVLSLKLPLPAVRLKPQKVCEHQTCPQPLWAMRSASESVGPASLHSGAPRRARAPGDALVLPRAPP